MESPLVSVVIPTYFRNELLAEAIESVNAQTNAHTEIIIVDDSGERHARPIADEYSVQYLSTPDIGPQAAREVGLAAVSGDFVQFLDDDDILKPAKLSSQLDRFETVDNNVGVVYSGYDWYDGSETVMPKPDARGEVLDYALQARLDPACAQTMLIERSVIEKVRPLRNNHGADIVGLLIELSVITRFEYVNESLVRLRRGDQRSTFSDPPAVTDGLRRILARYENMYEQTDAKNYLRIKTRYHRQRATELLEINQWSVLAVVHAVIAARFDQETRRKSILMIAAVLLGRPGLRAGKRIYDVAS